MPPGLKSPKSNLTSTTMWHPENEASFPTQEEYQLSINAINAMKEELAATESRIIQLDKELFKRRAFLAPIRRTPADILSLIFILVCEDDWTALVILETVCHHWKDVLLATPRACACLLSTPNLEFPPARVLKRWISHCGVLKLHINLPPTAPYSFVNLLRSHPKRPNIRCLSAFNKLDSLSGKFESLVEVRLGHNDDPYPDSELSSEGLGQEGDKSSETSSDEDPDQRSFDSDEMAFPISIENFPKLISLHFHGFAPGAIKFPASKHLFPSFQTLHIRNKGTTWLQIIGHCSISLVELMIDIVSDEGPEDQYDAVISLPMLHSLSYTFDQPEDFFPDWPIFHTPALRSYREAGSAYAPFMTKFIPFPRHTSLCATKSIGNHFGL
ncbi:hypothetical protein M408DRAFT_21658 [Serendipita vermifera MAFF 305830]|uniref:F-box domain-containing protein n=1 Tax=Serendipita vermifera MAFF 305830 TaxID=933852 RepID=A0A0C3B1X2_SERVB|nr:hypothetical protein M408DRAFT_21658 [Serendipita vermifera MAFF 305830]